MGLDLFADFTAARRSRAREPEAVGETVCFVEEFLALEPQNK